MKDRNRTRRVRRIIGTILLATAILLLADVVFVMLHKINAVVLKADYQEVFRYELEMFRFKAIFAVYVKIGCSGFAAAMTEKPVPSCFHLSRDMVSYQKEQRQGASA